VLRESWFVRSYANTPLTDHPTAPVTPCPNLVSTVAAAMLIRLLLHLECAKTAACRPHVHEYEECVARVTAAAEDENHPEHHRKEDCVEECKFSLLVFVYKDLRELSGHYTFGCKYDLLILTNLIPIQSSK